MSDPMHMSLTAFRETMLTAIARLEFELRDGTSVHSLRNATWLNTTASQPFGLPTRLTPQRSWEQDESSQEGESETTSQAMSAMLSGVETMLKGFETRLAALEARSSSEPSVVAELLTMEPRSDSKNVVVRSRTTTPALAAAVAAANPPGMSLDSHKEESDEEVEAEEQEEEEVEVEAETEEEEVEEEADVEVEVEEEAEEQAEEEPDLRPVIVKGTQYYVDVENTAYVETEDSYEAVGKYDPQSKTVTLDSEQEEEVEVEEFEYKGQTYQRDTDGNVYQDSDAVIGRWTGTKIVFKKA